MSSAHEIPGPGELSEAVLAILRLHRGLECVGTGLTPAQYRIMKLAAAGGERSTRLAERLAVAKPTLTVIAAGLVAAGYATRAAEPGDRRVVRLSLTPAGRAALDQADAAYAAWLSPLLAATGRPGQLIEDFGRLDAALAATRRAGACQSGPPGDGKERGHEHAQASQHGRPPRREGGRDR